MPITADDMYCLSIYRYAFTSEFGMWSDDAWYGFQHKSMWTYFSVWRLECYNISVFKAQEQEVYRHASIKLMNLSMLYQRWCTNCVISLDMKLNMWCLQGVIDGEAKQQSLHLTVVSLLCGVRIRIWRQDATYSTR